MRCLLYLLALLLLAANMTGCASKSPANANTPPGVTANPNRPDPEAIKSRKPMLIDPK